MGVLQDVVQSENKSGHKKQPVFLQVAYGEPGCISAYISKMRFILVLRADLLSIKKLLI